MKKTEGLESSAPRKHKNSCEKLHHIVKKNIEGVHHITKKIPKLAIETASLRPLVRNNKKNCFKWLESHKKTFQKILIYSLKLKKNDKNYRRCVNFRTLTTDQNF